MLTFDELVVVHRVAACGCCPPRCIIARLNSTFGITYADVQFTGIETWNAKCGTALNLSRRGSSARLIQAMSKVKIEPELTLQIAPPRLE